MSLIIKNAETLKKMIMEYMEIGDSYTYELTRTKAAFALGTMSVDAFEEWTEDDVDALVSHIIRNSVTITPLGDLIDRNELYEKTTDWEAQALHMVEVHANDEDNTEWRKWTTILTERSAFKFDVQDAPTIIPAEAGTQKDGGQDDV